MKKVFLVLMVMVLQPFWVVPLMGQNLIVFPAQGQTDEQMTEDKKICHDWAIKEIGFDPAQPQAVAQAPQTQSQGHSGARLKGAARGAAMGAVVGEIANDDAGQGAAAGAAAGVMAGGMKTRSAKRNQQKYQQAQTQQQEVTTEQQLSEFNRANSACLEGKGYTVQ